MEDRQSNCYWAIVDVEVSMSDHKIHDIGALRYDGAIYHGCKKEELENFLHDVDYLCGHNIINHRRRKGTRPLCAYLGMTVAMP